MSFADITKDLATKVDKIEIPRKYNVVAQYPIGILKQSKYPAEAEEFMDPVKSDKGMAILNKYGFIPVQSMKTPVKAATNATAVKASA